MRQKDPTSDMVLRPEHQDGLEPGGSKKQNEKPIYESVSSCPCECKADIYSPPPSPLRRCTIHDGVKRMPYKSIKWPHE